MSKLITCTKCGKKKQEHEFHIRSDRAKGSGSWCKLCISVRDKEYYELNKERIKQRQKEYAETRKEDKSLYNKEYRQNNKEKLNAYERDYYKKNTEVVATRKNELKMRRKAATNNSTPGWLSKDDISKMRSIYKMCRLISKKTGIQHEVDHIIPLISDVVSGLHVPWNLQIISKSENASKSNKLIEDMI